MSEPFDGLVAIIQYRGKMGVSPRRWKAMAAFDVKSLADDYLKIVQAAIDLGNIALSKSSLSRHKM